MNNSDIYLGINGWLILVAIIVCIQPLSFIYALVTVFHMEAFSVWSIIEGSTKYLLIFEYMLNILFIFVSLYLIFLFFKKKELFKITFFVFLVVVSIATLVDFAWVIFLFNDEPISELISVRDLASAIVPTLIWGPYILLSKRVKNTFVN